MDIDIPEFLTPINRKLIEARFEHLHLRELEPKIAPWWLRPCRVRVLMVVDGLDFSDDGFGLSTFVRTLLDVAFPVRYQVTLAHLRAAAPSEMLTGEARVAARITEFAFDDPAHFASDKYDVVFLFGIATQLPERTERLDADGNPYPIDALATSELRAIAAYEQSGGGLFATGDHGALGRLMGRDLPRARNMRLWNSTSGNPATDEVSMGGQRRNDTNRLGDAGSQFDDQSDAVPQTIEPRMYTAVTGFFTYSFPHPLLCGPDGIIRVMPDHPHEGECVEPDDPDQSLDYVGIDAPEYPPATVGSRPLPEVISTNQVLSGTVSGGKAPTQAHEFGGIAAYDGHRAGVGRVVTDATWHHFVNVNLVGDAFSITPAKRLGFLATPAGQEVLGQIKAYFRNLPVWLARPENIGCMNSRLLVTILNEDRVLEAVLTMREVPIHKIGAGTLRLIGRHARDVLGRYASRCQTRRLIFDVIIPELIEWIPDFDPWRPRSPEEVVVVNEPFAADAVGPVAWVDVDPLVDFALGGALLALSESLDRSRDARAWDAERIAAVARKGAGEAVERALADFDETIERARKTLRR
ncbi:hypothetical protein [Microbacterium sp. 2FI]|uniref:hypothetical protein n=1 Tax=Microbacterium sp. 2FI TaxID=2502193 RepID=UPI0010F99FE9|nr:hypothetical protein [Microbacterium sp. 2FI]